MRPHAGRIRALIPSFLAAVLLVGAASAVEAQNSQMGLRVGYDFDRNETLFSADLAVPVSRSVEFYPSVDVYTPERGNRLGFNGDFKVHFPTLSGPDVYVGGGIGVENRSVNGVHSSDMGVNLLMGIQGKTGTIRPFGEARVLMHDRSTTHLIGGLRFTIGR